MLREMEVREEPKTLLGSVSGLERKELKSEEVCCGFGGSLKRRKSISKDSSHAP